MVLLINFQYIGKLVNITGVNKIISPLWGSMRGGFRQKGLNGVQRANMSCISTSLLKADSPNKISVRTFIPRGNYRTYKPNARKRMDKHGVHQIYNDVNKLKLVWKKLITSKGPTVLDAGPYGDPKTAKKKNYDEWYRF